MNKVIHKKCGGQVGWVPCLVLGGSRMIASEFTHMDGSKPVMGTKMTEKCPNCEDWIRSGAEMMICDTDGVRL